ncbi:helix-turn-helix transcriptional regulator [Priestia aryabhattai]|uniref:helix-turn-helix domain-containing protein n=1 Tax=Priestia aryabhattai TaxID=412384 RepID=UPI002E239D81|nr:helix-turn-helix transcriptional regulator [Priestia aryabhattai]
MELREIQLIELGKKLKDLRKQKGLSLTEVGKAVDLSHNFLSEVERGKKQPSLEKIRLLANLYEINEDELFGIIDQIPLRVQELIENDKHLQDILSEAQRKFRKDPEKLETITKKIIKIYQDFLDEE